MGPYQTSPNIKTTAEGAFVEGGKERSFGESFLCLGRIN